MTTSLSTKVVRGLTALPRSRRELSVVTQLLWQFDRVGWQASIRGGVPTDQAGMPIPWWTYAANAWLDLSLRPHHRVFEFGSGNSTLWLANRVQDLHAVEHDQKWAALVQASLPPRVAYSVVPSSGDDADVPEDAEYLRPLKEATGDFDLIVIDGEGRNTCAAAAADRVGESGLILLDDADRAAYGPAHQQLNRLGFGRLDFFGPKPGLGYLSMTSVFARDIRPWMQHLSAPVSSGY